RARVDGYVSTRSGTGRRVATTGRREPVDKGQAGTLRQRKCLEHGETGWNPSTRCRAMTKTGWNSSTTPSRASLARGIYPNNGRGNRTAPRAERRYGKSSAHDGTSYRLWTKSEVGKRTGAWVKARARTTAWVTSAARQYTMAMERHNAMRRHRPAARMR